MFSFKYVNDLGCPKMMYVSSQHNGIWDTAIFNMANGEFCGVCDMTAQELTDFLGHYGVKIEIHGEEIVCK